MGKKGYLLTEFLGSFKRGGNINLEPTQVTVNTTAGESLLLHSFSTVQSSQTHFVGYSSFRVTPVIFGTVSLGKSASALVARGIPVRVCWDTVAEPIYKFRQDWYGFVKRTRWLLVGGRSISKEMIHSCIQ